MSIRAAMHVHSTWSYDGHWALDRIVPEFTRRGYQVLLMTEHDLGFSEERRQQYWAACRQASTDRLLVIPGMEYSDPSNTIHLLVWGDIPFLGAGQETMTVLEKVTAAGGVCVLAHPSRRSAWRLFRSEWRQHLAGIEIWNRKTDGWAASAEATRLIAETGARATVGLDFHSAKQLFPLAVLLELEGRPEEAKVLAALRRGAFRGEALGREVTAFTGKIAGPATRVLEGGRRLAARTYRFAVSSAQQVASWTKPRPGPGRKPNPKSTPAAPEND